jgi:tetratricopeptide (TPR) repeat protein
MHYVGLGRFSEAEPLFKRSLAISETALGPEHTDMGGTLNNLANLYQLQGRYAEAEPLFKRTVAIFEKVLGPHHADVGTSLNNLASIYDSLDRHRDAEPLYERSLAIREQALGPNHPSVGNGLNNLGRLYVIQARFSEAEPLLTRAVSIFEKALGPNHPDVGNSLRNLARLYEHQGQTAQAEALGARALAILEHALGPDHPDVGDSLADRALLNFAQQDWVKAESYFRQSTELVIRRSRRDAGSGGVLAGKTEAERAASRFRGLIRTSYSLAATDGASEPAIARRMFKTAQWAQSSDAAQSLAQMAARQTKDDGLAHLVRERQDLVAEWQAKDRLLMAARAEQAARRSADAEARLGERLVVIDARLAEIDATLKQGFPDYAALANPEPVSVEEVQGQLHADEALMLVLDTPETRTRPEETFIWVVTQTDMRWVRSGLGTPSLARAVAALRCGLDDASFSRYSSPKSPMPPLPARTCIVMRLGWRSATPSACCPRSPR